MDAPLPSLSSPADALLSWYQAHKRDLPWRGPVDPYPVWLSEVMLQQTRVETVIPYYHRFLEEFPTVELLAAAPGERVLRLWAGLGYYSRARALQAAAHAIVARGRFPSTVPDLLSLPGFGPYTAAAVASICFGVDVLAVDGNVQRVLCRLLDLRDDPTTTSGRATLLRLGGALLPPGRAGDFNQALMDLGSDVCTPRKPRCETCPLAPHCLGLARGSAPALPVKKPKAPPRELHAVTGVLRRGERLCLVRNPPGLLGGLWDLPGGEVAAEEELRDGLVRLLRARIQVEARPGQERGEVEHLFTHRRYKTRIFEVEFVGEPGGDYYTDLRFVDPEERSELPLSTLARKVLAQVDQRAESVGSKKRRASSRAAGSRDSSTTSTSTDPSSPQRG